MNLIQLKELRLNHNGLASVSPAAFMNIPKLTHLYLKNNQLSSVNSDFLQAFKQMEVLDLSFNMLKNVGLICIIRFRICLQFIYFFSHHHSKTSKALETSC